MDGDFNLPLGKRFGCVSSNSNCQHFRIQNKYLDLFTSKGLYKFVEVTRCKLVENKLDKARSCFSSNGRLRGDVNLKEPLGKLDHSCIEIEVKVKLDFDYINRKQRNWSNLTEELVSEKGDNIDWDYESNTLEINEMWEELNGKIKSIIKKNPDVTKFSKQRDPLEKLP